MNAELTVVAAFVAGVLGSGHCLGMCGGIAASLGMATAPSTSRFHQHLLATLYSLGRVVSYMLAGALIAGAGGALAGWIAMPGWSGALRIATGLIVAAIGLQWLLGWQLLAPVERAGARLWRVLAPLTRRLLPVRSAPGALALGLLWGWLPCGLVYSMLAAAGLAGDATSGAAIMGAFGLGTLPSMLTSTVAAKGLLRWTHQPALRRAAGAAVLAMGLWIAAWPLLHWLEPGHNHHAAVLAFPASGLLGR